MSEEIKSKSERPRKYTKKGFAWQLEQRTPVRSLVTKWKTSAEMLSILLSNREPDGIKKVLVRQDI